MSEFLRLPPEALTKEEHDAIMAHRSRPITQTPIQRRKRDGAHVPPSDADGSLLDRVAALIEERSA